jgi:hypothetical protein
MGRPHHDGYGQSSEQPVLGEHLYGEWGPAVNEEPESLCPLMTVAGPGIGRGLGERQTRFRCASDDTDVRCVRIPYQTTIDSFLESGVLPRVAATFFSWSKGHLCQ